MAPQRPQVVIIAAAKVGDILANDRYPVDFLEDNLLIQTNLVCPARQNGVESCRF